MGTDGLIIDIRWNVGGYVTAGPEAGLALLLNTSTETLVGFERSSSADLYALKPVAPTLLPFTVSADPNTLYDKPIAVLVGPWAVSQGDFTAYKFRHLPGARFFGKSVNGAVTGIIYEEPVVSGFYFMVPFFVLADHREPSTLLVRREFPLDELVWLDKDDVAQGDDTVVKKALSWITSVAHAHDVLASRRYFRPGTDTVRVTAHLENPNNHAISVMAYYKAGPFTLDSSEFIDDGKHGDGAGGDGVWGTAWKPPVTEEMYSVTVTTTDPDNSNLFAMPCSARFTTAGPLMFSSLLPDRVSRDLVVFRSPSVHNRSVQKTVPVVTGSIRMLEGDTVINKIYNWRISYGDVPPDSVVGTAQFFSLTLRSLGDTVRLALGVDLASDDYTYWRDTLTFLLGPFTEVDEQPSVVPEEFALRQNYPNPFNSISNFGFRIADLSWVTLKVYDLLGREVAVLVNERKAPGGYSVEWEARGLGSGVYLYRLTAGPFVSTRKCLLIK